MEKRFFISNGMNNNPKNKLDELLQNEFRALERHIILQSKIDNFKVLHDELNVRYRKSGGRCQPISYSDSRRYHYTPENSVISIYVSETFRLNLTPIKEGEIL